MAFQHHQQQQQLPENHLFYRHKSQQMDAPETSMHSHSRKDHMNQFKMRNREMSKRLSRLSRGINGHNNDMMSHQGMARGEVREDDSGSQLNR